MTEYISNADLIQRALDARLRNLHVAMPGRVERYIADRDAVDVQPMLQRHVPSGDPEDVAPVLETLPVLRAVPIVRPRGAGMFIGTPIAAGDFVLLIFAERDIGQWRVTGSISNPGDQRMHGLQAAMAIPGIFPVNDGPANISNTNIEIGKVDGSFRVTITPSRMEVGGNSDSAAKASEVDDQLNSLKAAINGWTPTGSGDGASLKLALQTWLADLCASSSNVLKIGG